MENVVQEKDTIRISVRELVEFILRSGDIDNRHTASAENAMQEGSRIHRMIQKRMGPDYKAEVPLKVLYAMEDYNLSVEGRADGIEDAHGMVMIDEIKGTYRDVAFMKEAVPVHVAQAKCYAYMYSRTLLPERELQEIKVRLTYCNMETEQIRYFDQTLPIKEIETWFEELIASYKKWADFEYRWRRERNESIRAMEFPFDYRDGQKELVTYVYQTIYHKKKLFLEAPTGVGKTIATVFPSIKAMERGMGERIFYLTAKTITRTVAENTFRLLRRQGLALKSVTLTAKDKICFLEESDCNPEACPYAKGHFDRVNEALFDMLVHEDDFDRETVEAYARKYSVCPFEFCLDISLFADAIIGDYNYLFDPHVYLKRFFAEGHSNNNIFLIDEAHNLLERGREMYSAVLVKEEFLALKRHIKEGILVASEGGKKTHYDKCVLYKDGYATRLENYLEKCNKQLLAMKKECDRYQVVEEIDDFVNPLLRLNGVLEAYLEETEDEIPPVREEILDLYFKIGHFLMIYELVDDKYVKYTQLLEDGSFALRLFCVDPSKNLSACMARGRSSILFSATFLPIQYYKKLLGGTPEDYEVYAKSVFEPEKRALLIGSDVTSKYTRRSDEEFYKIARYIDNIVRTKQGNYMVFCPSHAFMQDVYTFYMEYFWSDDVECIVQQDYMNESSREEFLARFDVGTSVDLNSVISFDIETEDAKTLIGFCVLGGIFSEGIDLKNDSLIGAIIVGTGLPQVCFERELLKDFFDKRGENGFDYSYRYPGMNKVLQAAGRVIRTAEDVGVVALLDERFLQGSYTRLFPREWEGYRIVNVENVERKVAEFWNEFEQEI